MVVVVHPNATYVSIKHFCENVPIPLRTCLCGIRKIIVPRGSGKPPCFMCGPTPGGFDAGPCPPGQICVNSACIPCPSGTTFCNNQCVQICSGGQVLNPTSCQCVCPSGMTECGNSCVNLSSDNNNCGSCGNACSGGQTCVGGMCPCLADSTLCGGNCVSCLGGQVPDPTSASANVPPVLCLAVAPV